MKLTMLFVHKYTHLDPLFFPTGNGEAVRGDAQDQPKRKVSTEKVDETWPKSMSFALNSTSVLILKLAFLPCLFVKLHTWYSMTSDFLCVNMNHSSNTTLVHID